MSPRGQSRSSSVFLDTSAHYALADPRDDNHDQARAISQRLIAQRWRLFTTNFVLAETHALLLVRRGHTVAWRVLQEIDRSTMTIVRVGLEDEKRARDIISRYDDKEFSLTDATSSAVMERLGISSAFAFDQHFTQYGLSVVATARL
ncbi:MAG: PIN domain-containing protein [Chloroflexota bacterium]|nr:MAG: PIN domain-containing protein [Chloroflexota bacterium]